MWLSSPPWTPKPFIPKTSHSFYKNQTSNRAKHIVHPWGQKANTASAFMEFRMVCVEMGKNSDLWTIWRALKEMDIVRRMSHRRCWPAEATVAHLLNSSLDIVMATPWNMTRIVRLTHVVTILEKESKLWVWMKVWGHQGKTGRNKGWSGPAKKRGGDVRDLVREMTEWFLNEAQWFPGSPCGTENTSY